MTVWTLEEILEVKMTEVLSVLSSLELETSNIEVLELTRESLRKRLQTELHNRGFTISTQDIVVSADIDSLFPRITTLRAYWRPTSSRGYLSGGPADGETVSVEFSLPDSMDFLPNTSSLAVHKGYSSYIYTLSGWDELERVWIYTPREETRRKLCEEE